MYIHIAYKEVYINYVCAMYVFTNYINVYIYNVQQCIYILRTTKYIHIMYKNLTYIVLYIHIKSMNIYIIYSGVLLNHVYEMYKHLIYKILFSYHG